MKSNEQSQVAGKCAKQKVNASTKKQSEKPAENDIIQLPGTATCDEQTKSFLFEPTEPVYGLMDGYVQHGVAQRLTDGTLSFVPVTQKRYRGMRIKKLEHGWLNLTNNDNFYLAISVPRSGTQNVGFVLYEEATKAALAANRFLNDTAARCGKSVNELTWDDIVRVHGMNLPSEWNRPAAQASLASKGAKVSKSQLASERNHGETQEPLTAKMDRIIYRDIEKQSEAVPYSEDLTQGGEVLPGDCRAKERPYKPYNKNNCKVTCKGCGKSHTNRRKGSDNQGLATGQSC